MWMMSLLLLHSLQKQKRHKGTKKEKEGNKSRVELRKKRRK